MSTQTTNKTFVHLDAKISALQHINNIILFLLRSLIHTQFVIIKTAQQVEEYASDQVTIQYNSKYSRCIFAKTQQRDKDADYYP